jgi:RNA polymerase sigma-70 factor (ECF subfamily)
MVDGHADIQDASLVARARKGDGVAFEALVRRYYRAAFAVALGQLGTAMEAEDVCQDAFLRALERLDDCDPARFGAWLLSIVRNRAHNYRAYLGLRRGPDHESVPATRAAAVRVAGPGDSGPPRDLARDELRAHLEEALGALSSIQREVLLLHDLDGRQHREIAGALDLSVGMSRYHLMQARRRMRATLGEEYAREYLNG